MAFEVINDGEATVRSIRSYLGTLQRYRNTSLALHNRHNESVSTLAAELLFKVEEMSADWHEDSEVWRWRNKFVEFVNQHNLV